MSFMPYDLGERLEKLEEALGGRSNVMAHAGAGDLASGGGGASAPNFTPHSAGGDLWLFGTDLPFAPAPSGSAQLGVYSPTAGLYRFGGRVYGFGWISHTATDPGTFLQLAAEPLPADFLPAGGGGTYLVRMENDNADAFAVWQFTVGGTTGLFNLDNTALGTDWNVSLDGVSWRGPA